MTKTVVGSFDNYREAQQVVQDLSRAGIPQSDINIVASNLRGEYRDQPPATGDALPTTADADAAARATEATSGAAAGAVTGGVIGGVAGLALAFTSLSIPVLGPIIAAGPIVATLAGAGVGVVAGGLIGALTDLGVPEEHAQYYAEAVRRGGALVTVRADDARVDEVTRVMQRHGAVDINKRAETWRQTGWEGFDESARPYTIDDLERERTVSTRTTTPRTSAEAAAADAAIPAAFDAYVIQFRSDFDRDYAGAGGRYEEYEPAYRWGYEHGGDYPTRDWDASEADVRRDWERANPNGEWERFKAAVRRGWDRFTGKVERTTGRDEPASRGV
jgi:uncharacterized membrane protein